MIPAELLAIAQATRATFGDGVRLKFAAWKGGSAGNPAYDDPGARSPPIEALLANKSASL